MSLRSASPSFSPPASTAEDHSDARRVEAPARIHAPAHPLTADEWTAWLAGWFTLLGLPPRDLANDALSSPPSARWQEAGEAPGAEPPLAMVFAPHPDDECIVGALPLRLRQEAGWRVCNVAVTLGSREDRRAQRWDELQAACEVLAFDLHRMTESGFEQIKPESADAQTPLWQSQVRETAALLAAHRPALVLLPHAGDGIPTHIGVHRLVTEALQQARLTTVVAQTEFWATQAAPNCLIETGLRDTARLVQALACHVGEIERNPYHRRLPAWMADNVRRGGELLAGPGQTPPPFGFGTLYRLTRWEAGQASHDLPPTFSSCEQPLAVSTLFSSDRS